MIEEEKDVAAAVSRRAQLYFSSACLLIQTSFEFFISCGLTLTVQLSIIQKTCDLIAKVHIRIQEGCRLHLGLHLGLRSPANERRAMVTF